MCNIIKFNNIKKIYAFGDLHGNFNDIPYIIKNENIRDSILIFCGDIAMGFCKKEYYKQIFNKITKTLSTYNDIVLFIRGNHDDPDSFNNNEYNRFKYIKLLKDYTIVSINDKYNILCIGGATSIDRTHRKERDKKFEILCKAQHDISLESYIPKTYWENESPIYDECYIDSIKNINIDYVMTHTCPDFCYPNNKEGLKYWVMRDKELIDDLENERKTMTKIYDRLIKNNHKIITWCYGHFHETHKDVHNDTLFRLIDMDSYGQMDFYEINC